MTTASLTPRRILIGSVILVVLMVAGWYMEILSPAQRHNTALRSEASHGSLSIMQLQSRLRSLEADVHQIPHAQAQEAAVESLLPASLSLPGAIEQIQATATAAGMVWTGEQTDTSSTTSYGTKAPAVGLQTKKITMTLVGTYPQAVQFLTAINTMDRLARVDYLSLSNSAATPSAGTQQMALSVTATLYYDNAPAPTMPKSVTVASSR